MKASTGIFLLQESSSGIRPLHLGSLKSWHTPLQPGLEDDLPLRPVKTYLECLPIR